MPSKLYPALCISCALHGAVFAVPEPEAMVGIVKGSTTAHFQGLEVRLGDEMSSSAPKKRSPQSLGERGGLAQEADRDFQEPASPGPRYLGLIDLDQPPLPRAEPDFASSFPLVSSDGGRLLLIVFVDPNGNVVRVDVESSDFPAVVAESAEAVLRDVKFFPGKYGGQPVHARMRVEITYD